MFPLRYLCLLIGILCITYIRPILADGDETAGTKPNCKLVKDDVEYDLSELANDYWRAEETLHTDDKKEYYLSICHPLKNLPANVNCTGENIGVCSVTSPEEGTEGNRPTIYETRGLIPKDFSIVDTGRLEYIYESAGVCNKSGRNEKFVTEIHMICPSKGQEGLKGPTLMSSPACHLFFAWMTKAACPKKIEFNTTTCIAKFSNSNLKLNLHSLHAGSYYNVSSADSKYEINICGPVTNGHCKNDNATICIVQEESKPVVLGTVKDMKLNWENDILVLLYKYESNSAEIKFFCDRTALSPQIYFVETTATNHIFSVKTAAVCTPETPQCILTDGKGNDYNLQPLHKTIGNWHVHDLRENQEQRGLFFINVCGELNQEEHYSCSPGPIGACLASVNEESSFNLGYLTSHPIINSDGSITILYTGGDKCKNGEHARSTRITLVCDEMEREPYLQDITETCEYVFYWLTPAACPQHQTTGTDCTVKDPLYGNVYDLTSLRNTKRDYNTSDGTHVYYLNICGPLLSQCGLENPTVSGVCQSHGQQSYSGGLATSTLKFNDGTLTMKYENGTGGCDGENRSSQIIFMCDHEESGYDGPHFIQESESCIYHFIWRTKHACPPFRVVDCSYISKNGTKFDLGELSSPFMNEEYFEGSRKFVINVCRSIVHNKDSRCPYEAAACIVDLKHGNESLNIGQVSSGPYIENERLKIKYTGGGVCKTDSSVQMETIIEFICDVKSLYPYPQLIREENCKYYFEWSTPEACPITAPIEKEEEGNCKISNPRTGYEFDLNPLKKQTGYDVNSDSELHLYLNVCDNVADQCPDADDGACTHTHTDENSISAGKANADLQFSPGFLFLHYDGGAPCNNGLTRDTWINFICGAEGSEEGPVLINDDLDNCTYHINWHTELACERRIDCYVDSWERRYDLSPLIRTTGNYETKDPKNPKQKFYLNVCRPLNHIVGLLCHPGSSACLSNSSSPSTPLNLGHPTARPILDYEEDQIQLMYSYGSMCPSNTGLPITSKISFNCDKQAGKGNPVFKRVTHDCQYQFEWNTSVICKEVEEETPDTGLVCQIMYEEAKTNIDLKPLQKPGGYEVPYGNKIYTINVCGSVCNKSGVCTKDGENYGLAEKSDLKWDMHKLQLTYFGGDACPPALSGHKTSTIYFQCDMQAGFGAPAVSKITGDLECSVIFIWKTNITCMEAIYSTDSPSNPIPLPPVINNTTNSTESSASASKKEDDNDSGTSTITSAVVTLLVISGIIFIIVLVLFKSHRGQRVMATARRILGIRGTTTLLLDDVS